MEHRPEKSSLSEKDLSLQQRYIFNVVKDHIKKSKVQRLNSSLGCVIAGHAGTGKYSLIHLIKAALDVQKVQDHTFNYIISSYTGLSAKQICGKTLHSSFGLPLSVPQTKEDLTRYLTQWRKTSACARLKAVSLIIIDEFSFIGRDYFVLIGKLLRVANPSESHIPFASKSIILCGDHYQLLPVNSVSLFHPEGNHQSYKLYKYLSTCFVLEQIFRQGGQSAKQTNYREFLKRLRNKQCNKADVELIRTRRKVVLTSSEREEFKDDLRVFPYRSEVHSYNAKALVERFPESILFINCHGRIFQVAVGARVIFTRNVPNLAQHGVTNSTVGTVKAILFNDGKQPTRFCELVDIFAVYVDIGSTEQSQSIPVFPDTCPKNDLPLALAYSVTIHRCQGIQLPKVVSVLGRSEFMTNCDYIIFSRVRSLEDVMLNDSFIDDDRLIRRRFGIGDTSTD